MTKLTLCIGLATALGFGVPALAAQTPATPPPPTQPVTQARATARADAKPARAVPAPGSRDCLRSTGSLIPPPKGQCLPVAGSSYSSEDLQRTGFNNVGRALQTLDPSITMGH